MNLADTLEAHADAEDPISFQGMRAIAVTLRTLATLDRVTRQDAAAMVHRQDAGVRWHILDGVI